MSDVLELYLWILYFVGSGYFYCAFDDKKLTASIAFFMFALSPVLIPILVGVSLSKRG